MKKQQGVFFKFAIGFALIAVILWGCKDNFSNAGLNLLPTNDLVKVAQVSEKSSIKAYTEQDVNQRTDNLNFNLLGTYNDSIFGKTSAGFACQFRLSYFPDSIFTKDAQVDSVVLYLYYKEVYGDTITPQHLKVYELTSDLNPDAKYYQDADLKGMTNGTPLADMIYTPKFKLDSLTSTYGSTKADPKDTVQQTIAIKLDNSFAQKLFSADSTTFSQNEDFLSFFKGLYIEAGDLDQGGALMAICPRGSSTIGRSYLVLHFHNDTTDSLYYSIGVNSTSARVGRFTHDYSTTAFATTLDNPDSQDSLIYLQSTGGLRTKITIPNLEHLSKLIPGIGKDSSDVIINGAELVFQIDTTASASNLTRYLPPSQLVLTAIDSLGNDYLPSDVVFSTLLYDGTYNSLDATYRFNIVKHLQEVIDKQKNNYGFYLSTAYRSAYYQSSYPSSSYQNSFYRRVVLKGPGSKVGIRLNITYSIMK